MKVVGEAVVVKNNIKSPQESPLGGFLYRV
jgi:hypothetical protein